MPSTTTKYPGLNFNPFLLSLRVDMYPPPMVNPWFTLAGEGTATQYYSNCAFEPALLIAYL